MKNSDKIKLLYITNGINGSGGLERVLSVKASYFTDYYKYEVTILSLNETNGNSFYDFSSNVKLCSIEVSGSPLKYLVTYRKKIQGILKEVQPDIISVCDDGLKGMLFPIFFGTKTPVIYERHVSKKIEVGSDKPTLLQKVIVALKFRLMNYGGKRFHKFIVLTQGNLKEWSFDNLQVIPNPLPFNSSEVSNLTNKKVIAVGKQSYQKGYDLLLQSWRIVNQQYPNWELEVYGKLDANLGLEEQVTLLGLQDSVRFHPPEKDIHKKYKTASIYVMSSRFEGFGMVLIEAMEYGLPCVSFDCPYGPSDIIRHGVDGYLVERGNTKELAHKMAKLIKNVNLRKAMSINANENVKRFKLPQIAEQWNDLFMSILNKNS